MKATEVMASPNVNKSTARIDTDRTTLADIISQSNCSTLLMTLKIAITEIGTIYILKMPMPNNC